MLKVKAFTNLGVRDIELSKETVENLNQQMEENPEGISYVDEEGHHLKILGIAIVTRAMIGKRIKVSEF